MSTTIRVWDLPTRIFHWALVVCVIGSVTTAQIGGDAMAWHFRSGYTILSLLLFRILWGMTGGRWSRFSSFLYSPATVLRYLKGQGQPEHAIGHTPLGAGSVFALLGFLLLQVATGLISDDEIASAGPLTQFASNAMVRAATYYHTHVGKLILLALILLHIGAISFYYFRKREDLIRPMIHGNKETTVQMQGSRDDAGSRAMAAAIFVGCGSLVYWLVNL